MDDNLFENPNQDPAPQDQPQKFTVGDKEYTQDELNDLVARGNFAKEVEAKFNTKLDRVVPDYTRSSMEAAELRKKVEAFEQEKLNERAQAGELTRDELIAKAKLEAQQIGLMTDQNTPELIRTEIERYDLERTILSQVDDLADKGISADPKVIARYMDAADIDRPQEAINQLYGPQIKMWQQAELAKEKPSNVYTEGGTNAGGFKLPPNIKVDDNNLLELFKQASGGGTD